MKDDQAMISGRTVIATAALALFLLVGALPRCAASAPTNLLTASTEYWISDRASRFFRGRDAHRLVTTYLDDHPQLVRRLTDPDHRTAAGWGYHSQTYRHHDAMIHLLALQIKAMADRGAIDDLEDVFDRRYGIGSKFHKDKGTMNNVFSIWGHPARTEILNGSRVAASVIYHLFRRSVKNDLIAFARSQPLDWHRQPLDAKVTATMDYLRQAHPVPTQSLAAQLQDCGLDLETLVRRIIRSNLVS